MSEGKTTAETSCWSQALWLWSSALLLWESSYLPSSQIDEFLHSEGCIALCHCPYYLASFVCLLEALRCPASPFAAAVPSAWNGLPFPSSSFSPLWVFLWYWSYLFNQVLISEIPCKEPWTWSQKFTFEPHVYFILGNHL